MIESTTLRYFYEVAAFGSVRVAAEKLFVAQSAVSRQIALLEDELGVPVFERHARGMALTAAGELLLRYAQDNKTQLADLKGQIHEYETLAKGHVRVGCVEGILHGLLSSFMPNFIRTHPGITFSLDLMGSHAVGESVAEHKYDLGILFGASPRPDLIELQKIDQPLCVIASPQHPLAQERSCTLAQVADAPLALPDRSFGLRQLVDRVSSKGKFKLNIAVETNSLSFASRLVAESDLITFQPSDVVAPLIEAGKVVAIPLTDASLRTARATLVASYSRRLSLAANHLSQSLIAYMQGWQRPLKPGRAAVPRATPSRARTK
ncbi:DNA-binding transcriptional LysR family regulator [Variovorax boronicumulans]|uniref:LysR family transcriptional regulator n=1 Tax=Variovorax TaxID=34072 RepID=UPI002787F8A1|nr:MULTISPECIES: LysR family transcriptional regulator [Variovorax]MDQ0038858.1 DNA-binding transcriptional LysR family regulator [Variovorax boronicumulans]MDQ0610835.1 DNA-binding transcriptional LysR family regulator [Variovorax sp. W1I1]